MHAELHHPEAAVQHIVGVFFALQDRREQRLAFIQAFANAPFLKANEPHQRFPGSVNHDLGEINRPPAALR